MIPISWADELFSGMHLLSVVNLNKYGNGDKVIDDISFAMRTGEKLAIAGETGSGKTTLLKMIAGLTQPDEGEIRLYGQRVAGPLEKLLPGHPAIAYHSQHFELRNNYRVEEELESKNKLSAQEGNKIYEVCRITHLLKRKTDQLSGGERQRIVLARMLVSYPSLLVLDEPFSNLDMIHKAIIRDVIHDISSSLSISCILVSHDPLDILPWADKILVLKNGKLIQQAGAREIYQHPINAYCAALFGEYNLVRDDTSGKDYVLRPEQIVLAKESGSSMTGRVQEVHFNGSHYLVQVQTARGILKLTVREKAPAIGETVYLRLPEDDRWYI